MKYLVLAPLQVRNANAQPSAWIVGPPSPTAYMGFAHHLGRALGSLARSVVIVHHDYALRAERIGNEVAPHQFRAASFINANDYASTNRHALALQPQARCDVLVSLAIEFDDDAAVPLATVARWLPAARVAGGTIESWETPTLCESLEAARAALGHGFAVHERADLLALSTGDRDCLDALLRATHPQNRQAEPWVTPALLGYRAITAITRRARVREDYPHAFAEPLIGLVQYRSLRDSECLPRWRYTRPAHGVFVVSTDSSAA